jgi:hypothetical protein
MRVRVRYCSKRVMAPVGGLPDKPQKAIPSVKRTYVGYRAGLFESLQDRRGGSRAERISGDGKLSCKSLQQLIGRCRSAVYFG